jgi:hypothetical protein
MAVRTTMLPSFLSSVELYNFNIFVLIFLCHLYNKRVIILTNKEYHSKVLYELYELVILIILYVKNNAINNIKLE